MGARAKPLIELGFLAAAAGALLIHPAHGQSAAGPHDDRGYYAALDTGRHSGRDSRTTAPPAGKARSIAGSGPLAEVEPGDGSNRPVRADQTAAAPPSSPLKWGAHLDLEGKLGTSRDLGEADVFLPLLQNGTSLLFGNVKARLDDNASREGNFGLGVRHMLEAGWNLGTYGYFDRRRTENYNFYNQATFGAEALSVDWDFRANAYVPFGRRTHLLGGGGSGGGTSTAALVGTTVQVTTTGTLVVEETSMAGFDAEVGWRVPLFSREAGQQFRVYGGAYRFYADGVDPVQGPRARAELTFDEVPYLWEGSRLTLGGEAQHDGPRGKTGFVTARLRIPLQVFGAGQAVAALTPMERRMTDPVIRDIDIVAQSRTTGSGATTVETATAVSGGGTLAVVDSGTTNGTAAIQTAVTNAGNNSTVILSGTFTTTGNVTLQTGQTLMGNGSVTVQTPSGRTATLTTSTGATYTGNDPGTTVLTMAANSTIKGLTITAAETLGNPATAIRVNGVSGVSILNNTITATTAAGGTARALFLDTTTITVSGNTLSASGGATNRRVDVANTTFNAGSTGNVNTAGACNDRGGNTGSMSFTDSSTCP